MSEISKIYVFLTKNKDWQDVMDANGDGEIIQAECRYYLKEHLDELDLEDKSKADNIISRFWNSINSNRINKSLVNLDGNEIDAMNDKIEVYEKFEEYFQNNIIPMLSYNKYITTPEMKEEWIKSVKTSLLNSVEEFIAKGGNADNLEDFLNGKLDDRFYKDPANKNVTQLAINKTTANVYIQKQIKDRLMAEFGEDIKLDDLNSLVNQYIQKITADESLDTVIEGLKQIVKEYFDSKKLTDYNKNILFRAIKATLEREINSEQATNTGMTVKTLIAKVGENAMENVKSSFIESIIAGATDENWQDLKNCTSYIKEFKSSEIYRTLEAPIVINNAMGEQKQSNGNTEYTGGLFKNLMALGFGPRFLDTIYNMYITGDSRIQNIIENALQQWIDNPTLTETMLQTMMAEAIGDLGLDVFEGNITGLPGSVIIEHGDQKNYVLGANLSNDNPNRAIDQSKINFSVTSGNATIGADGKTITVAGNSMSGTYTVVVELIYDGQRTGITTTMQVTNTPNVKDIIGTSTSRIGDLGIDVGDLKAWGTNGYNTKSDDGYPGGEPISDLSLADLYNSDSTVTLYWDEGWTLDEDDDGLWDNAKKGFGYLINIIKQSLINAGLDSGYVEKACTTVKNSYTRDYTDLGDHDPGDNDDGYHVHNDYLNKYRSTYSHQIVAYENLYYKDSAIYAVKVKDVIDDIIKKYYELINSGESTTSGGRSVSTSGSRSGGVTGTRGTGTPGASRGGR